MKYWRQLVIVAVVLWSAWALLPSIQYYSMSADAREALPPDEKTEYIDSAIKLGLDLQGGMYIVLEIDDSELTDNEKEDAIDRAIEILRNRIDQFGVAEPIIQKQGNKRIIVQLPGLQDRVRALELIGRTAQLEFYLVRDDNELADVRTRLDAALEDVTIEAGGIVVDTTAVEMDDSLSMEPGEDTGDETQMVENDGSQMVTDTATTSAAFDTLIPEIPGTGELEVPVRDLAAADPAHKFSSFLITAYGGAFVIDQSEKALMERVLETPQVQRAMPRDSKFMWSKEAQPLEGGGEGRLLYLVEKEPTLKGDKLVDATTRPDPDDPSRLNVSFSLDRQGALIFSRFTGENIGRRIAIALDNTIQSAPVVQSKIPGGEGRITGDFTDEEANDLAIILRAGALPAPVEPKEERTIGPTLGHDSIVLGVRAAIIGFIIVMAFMIVYYQASGLLACVALVLNLAIVLAVLAELRAALTLPGIAGLILTIGMAVDANVLIFERIREELAKAKTVRSAIDSGYERAFTTILDANVTTLITAFVLWQFGTGPIKGFATVLSIGIVASMFTALIFTRVVYDMLTARFQIRKLSI